MFEVLNKRFSRLVRKIGGKKRLHPSDLTEAIDDVRTSLLSADVNFKVVESFVQSVKEKAVGQTITKGIDPGHQFMKIVQDELVSVMGGEHRELSLKEDSPSVILVIGPNGQGKTTFCGKLALSLKKKGKNVLLVPADTFRPAAKKQLEVLGKSVEVECFDSDLSKSPEKIALSSLKRDSDVVVIDTAGRLYGDVKLMKQLKTMRKKLNSFHVQTLLVVDSMIGQDAVSMAEKFHEQINLDGFVLSKMDSDAKGGAALSIRYLTGVPVLYLSTGEKMNDLESFHPDRLAGRILDRGDVVSLVEKAQEEIQKDDADEMMENLAKGRLSMDSFVKQMAMMKKLGSMKNILGMLPGMGGLAGQTGQLSKIEDEMKKAKTIISSMTKQEKDNHKIIGQSRMIRIAKGSGTQLADVRKFLQDFTRMEQMMGQMGQGMSHDFLKQPLPQKKKKKGSSWGKRYF